MNIREKIENIRSLINKKSRFDFAEKVWISAISRLARIFPGFLLGQPKVMRQKYGSLYYQEDFDLKVKDLIHKNLKLYLLVIIFTVLGSMLALIVGLVNENKDLLVERNGETWVRRPGEGQESYVIPLSVRVENGDRELRYKVSLEVRPEGGLVEELDVQEEYVEDRVQSKEVGRRVRLLVKSLSENTSEAGIVLPKNLENIGQLTWEIKSNSSQIFIILLVGILCFLMVYRGRYSTLKTDYEAAILSVKKDMPEFINRMVLLLNAGLVLSSAFEKACEGKDGKGDSPSYFYMEMNNIKTEMSETQISFIAAFNNFAEKTGSKEARRIARILKDSQEKGVSPVETLEKEGTILWFYRKKEVEEAGRVAEVKMTFPLVILLLVVVLITVAPAMMDM